MSDDEDDLTPARMLNELTYCPRLSYLEHVLGEWEESADTDSGRRAQLSVFRCDLTARQKEQLRLSLSDIIKPSEDQVLFIELGPSESRMAERISALGKPCRETAREPFVF